MTGQWKSSVQARGAELGQARVDHLTSQLETGLADDLPDHVQVRQDGDALVISGPNLTGELQDNGSLWDIGFLLQGVR
ncbi:MAG: hypothetical protein AAGE37_02350 [Pseudomonadota bacterium]